MKLYLMQHGDARSKGDDPERRLTERGETDTRKMAEYVVAHGLIDIRRILHSGKARAAQTAEIVAAHLKSAYETGEVDDLGPKDDVAIWGRKFDQDRENVMLVGHLPHLGRLATLLLRGNPNKPIINFRNSGIVCLAKNGGEWLVEWILTPDLI